MKIFRHDKNLSTFLDYEKYYWKRESAYNENYFKTMDIFLSGSLKHKT